MPVDHLHALRQLAAHFRGPGLSRTVVVSPDLGYAKSATMFARMLGLPVAAGAKQRHSDTSVTISAIIGDVDGRDVIVIDDEIARGTTIEELLDRLAGRPEVEEIVCTNTVPIPPDKRDKLEVISIGPALAEAIRRIHDGESVSALFEPV